MTEYLEPADVEELIESAGFHIRDRSLLLSALAAPLPVFGEDVYLGLVRDGDEFVRSVADHRIEFTGVADWIERHTSRL